MGIKQELMSIARTVAISTLQQLFFTIGFVVVFGFIVGLMNKAFHRLAGDKFGRIFSIVTGFIGTPIHEMGHALFCLVFRHKILKIRLYQPNSDDGTLGYVNHSYNKRNIYQQIGNFFIGFGPILFGSAVLLIFMFWLVPNIFEVYRNSADFSKIQIADIFHFSVVNDIFVVMKTTTINFFLSSEPGNWKWWLFIIPACSIAMHMSLSVPDIKSSWVGFCFIMLSLLIINANLYFMDIEKITVLSGYYLKAGTFILSFLSISILLSVLLLLLGVIIKVITILGKRFVIMR